MMEDIKFLTVGRTKQWYSHEGLHETNSEFTPEKWWLGDYFPFGKAYFQVLC